MTVSQNRIVKGAVDYIANEVIPHILDSGMRIAIAALSASFRTNPAAVEKVFNNPVVSMLLVRDEQGMYDVEHTLNAVKDAMSKYGQLTINVPPIPLISKGEKTLSFSAQDVEKLVQYIDRSDDA